MKKTIIGLMVSFATISSLTAHEIPTIMETLDSETITAFQKTLHADGHDYRSAFEKHKYISDNDGLAEEQFYTGYCYNKGIGTKKNYTQAVKYYTLSSDQGYTEAQANLAVMYYYGYGVGKNRMKSCDLWKKAYSGGNKSVGKFLRGCRNYK